MTADAFFAVVLAGFVAHELDAVDKREWRLLFVLRRLPEPTARDAFVVLHLPLLAGLVWATLLAGDGVRLASQAATDLFLLIHAGLHHRLRRHPEYRFHSPLSRTWILGTALVAAVHLLLVRFI